MSKLQYGLVFSMNALQQHKQKLQVVQNRALQICCLTDRFVSNYQNHVLPIRLCSKLDLLILMFKISRRAVSGNTSLLVTSQRTTRLNAAPVLDIVRPNTSVFLRSKSYVGPNQWNSLPAQIRFLTDVDCFKKYVRQRIDQEFLSLTSI